MSQLCDASECQSHQARWAVIVTLGRVVVEAETADADWFLLWGPQVKGRRGQMMRFSGISGSGSALPVEEGRPSPPNVASKLERPTIAS